MYGAPYEACTIAYRSLLVIFWLDMSEVGFSTMHSFDGQSEGSPPLILFIVSLLDAVQTQQQEKVMSGNKNDI